MLDKTFKGSSVNYQFMLSGALIKTPDDFHIEHLNGASWVRQIGELTLRSVVQFQERPLVIDGNTSAQKAMVIHEDIAVEPSLIREDDGTYSIMHHDAVKTTWANIYAIRGYVVVDRLENRSFVRQIISKSLGATIITHNIFLDTPRMARDHADQWIRGFSDRMGRVDRGTVFGEAVERDPVFGPELDRSSKKSVGWVTNFFGSPTKVKVSPAGSVTLWANPPEALFLRFLKLEILPYMIALP